VVFPHTTAPSQHGFYCSFLTRLSRAPTSEWLPAQIYHTLSQTSTQILNLSQTSTQILNLSQTSTQILNLSQTSTLICYLATLRSILILSLAPCPTTTRWLVNTPPSRPMLTFCLPSRALSPALALCPSLTFALVEAPLRALSLFQVVSAYF
jgi:hypothetical protein